MSRAIDDVIDFVRNKWYSFGSETQRQVVINRLDVPPTREELARAHEQLYGK